MDENKPTTRARNVGKADVQQLEAEGRIEHVPGRGYDTEPNPPRGPVLGDNGWRKGLTPEKYQVMLEKEAELKKDGSREKVAPNLYDFEKPLYKEWFANKPAKNEEEVVEEVVEEAEEEAEEVETES